MSASTSLCVTMYSNRSALCVMRTAFAPGERPKYDRVRERKSIALPTYSTRSSAAWKR